MTQVCPVLGVAPVPAFVSVILRPDDVVMVAPVIWAVVPVGATAATMPANAIAIGVVARSKARILGSLIDCVVVQAAATCSVRRPAAIAASRRQRNLVPADLEYLAARGAG